MVAVAGRIVSKREQGKLLFYTIKADGANVQVMASLADYEGGEEAFWKVRQAGKSRMDKRTRRGGEGGGGRLLERFLYIAIPITKEKHEACPVDASDAFRSNLLGCPGRRGAPTPLTFSGEGRGGGC